ncbi:hypothetical protein [Qipengyuania sp.]|uniref:hypothetical protein n=1 Tax=Qipengyuania sp. TaxID=2004515 RepID=UPI003735DE87
MMKLSQFGRSYDMTRPADNGDYTEGLPRETRRHMIQRLQIGAIGVVLMVLLVGLASVIQNRAAQAEGTNLPATVPAAKQGAAPPVASDPLVEAGVVPDMPSETPETASTLSPAPVPEQGAGGANPPAN